MKVEDFEQLLIKNHAYHTPPRPDRKFLDRLLGRFDFWYYLLLFKIVLSAHIIARKNKFDRKAWRNHSMQTFLLIERCGGKLNISGLEHVANRDRPAVYVANHMSLAETFLLPGLVLLFSDANIVVKQSLMTYPLFGRTMQQIEPIAVSRKNPRDDLRTVLDQGSKCLTSGMSVLLFPQATRTPRFDPATFNTLGVKLARKNNAPILPVALKTDFMGIGKTFRDFGRIDRSKTVSFKFGPPLAIRDAGKHQHNEIISFITDNLKAWDHEVA